MRSFAREHHTGFGHHWRPRGRLYCQVCFDVLVSTQADSDPTRGSPRRRLNWGPSMPPSFRQATKQPLFSRYLCLAFSAIVLSGCSSDLANSIRLGPDPVAYDNQPAEICAPTDDTGRLAFSLDVLKNVSEDTVSVDSVSLVDPNDVELREFYLQVVPPGGGTYGGEYAGPWPNSANTGLRSLGPGEIAFLWVELQLTGMKTGTDEGSTEALDVTYSSATASRELQTVTRFVAKDAWCF
jgi:hypothetical protein